MVLILYTLMDEISYRFFVLYIIHFFRNFQNVIPAFSEGMVDDGYEDVVNVDISSVVIEAMRKKYFNRPQLKCIYFPLVV